MAILRADTTIGGIPVVDFVFPVGSIYETYSSSFSPSEYWGGTWERIKGRVLVGVNEDDTTFASAGLTGGSKTVTLATSQIPSHTHTFTGSSVTSGYDSPNHTHSGTTAGAGAHTHQIGGDKDVTFNTAGSCYSLHIAASGAQAWTSYASNPGNHTHTFTTGGVSASHQHTVTAKGSNANTGGGGSHTNLQPYYVVYIWRRTA